MSDTESSLSVGGFGSASSADEAVVVQVSDDDERSNDNFKKKKKNKPLFEQEFLAGLGNLQLRKLARTHGIATNLQPRGTRVNADVAMQWVCAERVCTHAVV